MTLFAIDRAIMMPFFIVNLLLWAALVAYIVWDHNWGIGARKQKGPRHGDPMRLGAAGTAIMMVGFSLRWIIAPDLLIVWKLLYVLSAAIAVYTIIVARAYGRGPVVG